EFRRAEQAIRSTLEMLPRSSSLAPLREVTLKLLALGEGKDSVFKLRQRQLDAADYGDLILRETRKLNVGLDMSVQQLVEGVKSETDNATWLARREISFATLVMLGLGGLTLLGSALFVWLYVGRSILRRLGSLQRSMQLLSDEIGRASCRER